MCGCADVCACVIMYVCVYYCMGVLVCWWVGVDVYVCECVDGMHVSVRVCMCVGLWVCVV